MDPMVIETTESILSYLQKVEENLPQMISDYRMNDIQAASSDLIEFTEGLIWLSQAMRLTYEFHTQSVHHLTDIYKGILSGVENQDYFLIADIVEYELLPSLLEFKNCIQERLNDYYRRVEG